MYSVMLSQTYRARYYLIWNKVLSCLCYAVCDILEPKLAVKFLQNVKIEPKQM